MIRHFETPRDLEPEQTNQMQWGAALGAGVVAGVILLLVPRGSPWSAITFFSPVVMGRALGPLSQLPLLLVWIIHLAVSIVYGLIIARVVAALRQQRAILMGGALGLILYIINFGVVSTFWPDLRANELSVIFTHVVFGLISAGAYRGLLSPRTVARHPADR